MRKTTELCSNCPLKKSPITYKLKDARYFSLGIARIGDDTDASVWISFTEGLGTEFDETSETLQLNANDPLINKVARIVKEQHDFSSKPGKLTPTMQTLKNAVLKHIKECKEPPSRDKCGAMNAAIVRKLLSEVKI